MPSFSWPVPAGFPSPANDYLDSASDLPRLLFCNLASRFLARVSGDLVAVVGGEHTIKQLQLRAGKPWLVAENSRYPPLPRKDWRASASPAPPTAPACR